MKALLVLAGTIFGSSFLIHKFYGLDQGFSFTKTLFTMGIPVGLFTGLAIWYLTGWVKK